MTAPTQAATDTEGTTATQPVPSEDIGRRTIEVDGRPMRYVDTGTGDVLLVIHGGGGWRGRLSTAHADLATDHRVISPELPGFGDTPGDGIDSVRDMARVFARLMVELGIPSYSVVGTSIGAAVALWVAIDSPDTVSKMVLEAPAAFREGAPPPGPRPGGGPGPSAAHIAFMNRVLGPATDPDLVAAMPGCDVPTLVLFGQDDAIFSPRFAPEYKRLPASNLAIVYAAGHDISGQRPEAYLETVRDYLLRGAAFVVNRSTTLIRP